MNIYVISIVIIVTASTGLLGLVVHLSNKRRVLNAIFTCFTLFIGLWIISNFLTDLARSTSLALLWCRSSFAAAVLIAFSFYCFANVFPSYKRIYPLNIYPLGLITLAMVYASFTHYIVESVEIKNWGANTINGDLFILFPLYFISVMSLGFMTLIKKLKSSRGLEKLQIQYILAGTLIAVILGLATNVFLPLATGSTKYAKFGSFSTVIFLAFATYAIIRHRLMDIRMLVVKSIAYMIFISILGLFFVIAVRLAKANLEIFINKDIVFIMAGLLAAYGFQPLKKLTEHYTDNIFARRRYNFNELLTQLGTVLSSTVALEDLMKDLTDLLVAEMRLSNGVFITAISESEVIYYNTSKQVLSRIRVQRLVNSISDAEIKVAEYDAISAQMNLMMKNLGAAVMMPLVSDQGTVGVLFLGEKKSGEIVSSIDVKLLKIAAPEIAIAIQHACLFKQKEQRILELNALSRLSLGLGSTLDLDSILEMVVNEAIEATAAENASIMLIDEAKGHLSIRASRGLHQIAAYNSIAKVGEGISGWVAEHNEPILIVKGKHENRYLNSCLKREEISSSLTVPLRVKENVIGVLSVNRKKKKEPFTDEHLRLVNSFAAHAAEAIENARLYEDLEATFLGTISALAKAVDARDRYTFGHSEEVTRYGMAIAKKLGLSQADIKNIEIAGRLHDIGKIGVDDRILNKPAQLTADERQIIQQHPRIAVDILKSVDMLKDAIPLILYHHEHFNGRGYPAGLSGNTIPIGARILTVADSFNAMVSNRPYADPKPLNVAIAELKRCSGTQFDPHVVKAFLEVLDEEPRSSQAEVDVSEKDKACV